MKRNFPFQQRDYRYDKFHIERGKVRVDCKCERQVLQDFSCFGTYFTFPHKQNSKGKIFVWNNFSLFVHIHLIYILNILKRRNIKNMNDVVLLKVFYGKPEHFMYRQYIAKTWFELLCKCLKRLISMPFCENDHVLPFELSTRTVLLTNPVVKKLRELRYLLISFQVIWVD